jgi:hypothetical protein
MYNMRKTRVKRKSGRRVYTRKMRGGTVYKCTRGYKQGYNSSSFNTEMNRLNWNSPTGKDSYANKACVNGVYNSYN